MNEGDNFGTGSNDSGQPSAVMSGPSDGAPNSSKFFGSHSRRSVNSGARASRNDFLAAQSIASNPNNPEFFRAAAAENSVASAAPRKSKKPLIIGLFALVAVIAVVAAVLLIPNFIGSGSEEEPKVSKAEVKKAFNKYANYLLVGEESDADFDLSTRAEGYLEDMPYVVFAERVLDDRQKDTEKPQYFNKLNDYYDAFAKKYNNSVFGELPGNILKDYFYGYALMSTYSSSDTYNYYLKDKDITVDDIIKERFVYESANEYINNYKLAQSKIISNDLLAMKIADKNNCINESGIDTACFRRHIDGSVEFYDRKEAYSIINKTPRLLRGPAMEELSALYKKIYEIEDKNTEVKL